MASRQDDFKPTDEQAAILDDAREHAAANRRIAAGPGVGKTRTLLELSRLRKEPSWFFVFNRPVKDKAKQIFPRHVRCVTPHGAAFGEMAMHDQQDRLDRRLFPDTVRELVRLPRARIPPDALGQVVIDTVNRWCNSADKSLSLEHVALHPEEPEDLKLAALAGAQSLWERMADPLDACPITHDVYLKLWQLSGNKVRGPDYLMLDEAQDASPVMVDILLKQSLPLTSVGDSNQAIYAWRGAVNAMRMMPGKEFHLSRSWRFGQQIADAANAVMGCKPDGARGAPRIIGNPDLMSQIGRIPAGTPHAFISRTNAEWFEAALASDCPIHVLGGFEETERLLVGAWELWRHNHRPAGVPAIGRFSTWKSLCEHAERFEDRELAFARRIIEEYRDEFPRCMTAIRARHVPREEDAALVLSTAHKAKGREWDLVRLGSGFPSPADPKWRQMPVADREAELNLLFVAASRARLGLEPNAAVLDCMSIAKGVATGATDYTRLSAILVAKEPPGPTARANPAPADGTGRLPLPWKPDEDARLIEMLEGGLETEAIAARLDRPKCAVDLRAALLGASADPTRLVTEALLALIPVSRPRN